MYFVVDKASLIRVCITVVILLCVKCGEIRTQGEGAQPAEKERRMLDGLFEVVHPQQFLSQGRWRRSIDTQTQGQRRHHMDSVLFYVQGMGKQFLLELALNKVLLPVNSKATHFSSSGFPIVQTLLGEEHCYYQGSVQGLPGSSVAVSTCHGLEGLIFDGNESYYIEPVRYNNSKTTRPYHIMYRMKDLKLPATKCGQGMLDSQHIINNMYKSNSHKRDRRNIKSEQKFVELIIVNDFSQYDYHKRDLDKTQKRARSIANLVDSLYRQLNVRVVLIHMVTWNRGDPVQIVPESDTTLDNFVKWRNDELFKKYPNDNAQLLTHIDFKGATVGKAHVFAMCTSRSAGVVQDHAINAAATAATFAHEMGHNFGMSHDNEVPNCQCADSDKNQGCIMSGVARSIPATQWSSCSKKSFINLLEKGLDACLFNKPKMSFGEAVCGNGFKEEGEECDCGTSQECLKYSDSCCNSTTCKLVPGAECDEGPCCDECKLKPAGSLCREKVTECDLPEFCTGSSELCPSNKYVHNGRLCDNGKGYCYLGICPTLNSQCQILWGAGVHSGPKLCYTINMKGNYYGSCHQFSNGSYARCKLKDIFCGMLHCTNTKTDLPIIGTERQVYKYTWPTKDGGSVQCKSTTLEVGHDVPDPGVSKEGTKCGDDKVCLGRKCVNITELLSRSPQCPNGCSSQGICNNEGDCFCDDCWTGSDCSKETPCAKSGKTGSNVIAVLVIFPILLFIAGVTAYIYRNTLKSKWQQYRESRIRRYESVEAKGRPSSRAQRGTAQKPSTNKRQISGPVTEHNYIEHVPPVTTTHKPVPAASRPFRLPPQRPIGQAAKKPSPGKIELPNWPEDRKEGEAAILPVTRRPPPPRPTAPKDRSLHRASSPPAVPPETKPAAASRPSSLAGVLDRKPLPTVPGKKAALWPPPSKASSEGSALDGKPARPPPVPPPAAKIPGSLPGAKPLVSKLKPVIPTPPKKIESSESTVKPSDIKKSQGKPMSKPVAPPARPTMHSPGKPFKLPPVATDRALPPIPPGVKKSTS